MKAGWAVAVRPAIVRRPGSWAVGPRGRRKLCDASWAIGLIYGVDHVIYGVAKILYKQSVSDQQEDNEREMLPGVLLN